jgi:AAA domain
MNYRNLYTLERFRPTQPALLPANDHGGPRPAAAIRPNGDGTRTRAEEPVRIHRFVDLKVKRSLLRYTIDGVVWRGRIYTATGPTHAGKTALWTMAALAVATGRSDILGLNVERGRVLYLAIENPNDTVLRFTLAQRFFSIPKFSLRDSLFIVTEKATPESVFAALEDLAQSGGFALIIVDTLAAFFDGTDMNDNVAAGNFMRRLRALSTVLGNPAVVVPAHPIKGATPASLSPYGGGAIVNEVDGNLTLWRLGNACRLHWQTKLRGPEFAPVFFRFREYGCNAVRDAKGRPVMMPLLVPVAREAAAQLAPPDRLQDRQQSARDAKLLRAMLAKPKGTQQDWATATGVVKSNVNRRLMRLKGEGLVRGAGGRWTVTPAGRRVARPTQMKMPPGSR